MERRDGKSGRGESDRTGIRQMTAGESLRRPLARSVHPMTGENDGGGHEGEDEHDDRGMGKEE